MRFSSSVFLPFGALFVGIAEKSRQHRDKKAKHHIFERKRYLIPAAKALVFSEGKEKRQRVYKLQNHERRSGNEKKRASFPEAFPPRPFKHRKYLFQKYQPSVNRIFSILYIEIFRLSSQNFRIFRMILPRYPLSPVFCINIHIWYNFAYI